MKNVIPAHITAAPLVELTPTAANLAFQTHNLSYLTALQIASIPAGDVTFVTTAPLIKPDEIVLKSVPGAPGFFLVAGPQSESPWMPGAAFNLHGLLASG